MEANSAPEGLDLAKLADVMEEVLSSGEVRPGAEKIGRFQVERQPAEGVALIARQTDEGEDRSAPGMTFTIFDESEHRLPVYPDDLPFLPNHVVMAIEKADGSQVYAHWPDVEEPHAIAEEMKEQSLQDGWAVSDERRTPGITLTRGDDTRMIVPTVIGDAKRVYVMLFRR